MPLSVLVAMLNMQIGEVIFGGVGSGLYGMLILVLLTVFIAGLMVGRTPEYGQENRTARDYTGTRSCSRVSRCSYARPRTPTNCQPNGSTRRRLAIWQAAGLALIHARSPHSLQAVQALWLAPPVASKVASRSGS